MDNVNIAIEVTKKCTIIASKFANIMMDHGASLYSPVSLHEDGFSFSYGPSTHGLSRYEKLSYSFLEDKDGLEDFAKSKKTEIEEERKKNTCQYCGAYNSLIIDTYQ